MDIFYSANNHNTDRAMVYSPESIDSSSLSSPASQFNIPLSDNNQFNLDDFILDEWTSPSSSTYTDTDNNQIVFDTINTMNNINQEFTANPGKNQLSDNDSDSGLGISSSSNSPKTLQYDKFTDFIIDNSNNQLNLVDSNSIDFANIFNSNQLNESNLQLQQNNSNLKSKTQNEHLTDLLTNILVESNNDVEQLEDSDADTEALLNNIEAMLKNIQQQDEEDKTIASNNTKRIQAQKNLIKAIRQKKQINQETNKSFKKISPKLTQAPLIQQKTAQQITQPLPVLTVPSPEKLKSNQIQLVNKQPTPQILNLIKPTQQQQPLTVLTAIPAVNCATSSLPIIFTSNPTSSITPNTIIIDNSPKDQMPNAKRLKQEPKKSVSPVSSHFQSPTATLAILTSNQVLTQPASISAKSDLVSLDPSLIKKQNRMIKNRESACLSRKRKKEYVQNLEDNIKSLTQKNEELTKQNQELKEKLKNLENENKQLKEQQQTQQKIKVIDAQSLNKPKFQITSLKTIPLNASLNGSNLISLKPVTNTNQTSLKRPFIMLAVFLIFGLNIFNFVNINGTTNSNELQLYLAKSNKLEQSFLDKEAVELAALARANALDGALVDSSVFLKQQHLNSRRLLSNSEYFSHDEEKDHTKSKVNSTNSSSNQKPYNLTKKSNESMELVLINGTWHLIDLNVCYQKMFTETNYTHVKKINNELNGWFERHFVSNSNQNPSKSHSTPQSEKHTSSSLLRNSRLSRRTNSRKEIINKKLGSKQDYAVSLYDNQNGKYETFAKSVRQRNDTFYYVSFRRDHVMFPALIQNKTQRPKMSLLMPALLTSLNGSNNSNHGQVAFMQIDCEVIDTKLFYLNANDIPLNFMKIIHQEYFMNQPETSES